MNHYEWNRWRLSRWYHRHEPAILATLAIVALLLGCMLEATH